VRAGGLERLDLAASVREGVESRELALLEENPSEPTRTTAVARLATALATAVVEGDLAQARVLAEELIEMLVAAA
jgi:hypothetical protein